MKNIQKYGKIVYGIYLFISHMLIRLGWLRCKDESAGEDFEWKNKARR
jgi:hypothetical protein